MFKQYFDAWMALGCPDQISIRHETGDYVLDKHGSESWVWCNSHNQFKGFASYEDALKSLCSYIYKIERGA